MNERRHATPLIVPAALLTFIGLALGWTVARNTTRRSLASGCSDPVLHPHATAPGARRPGDG